MHFGTHSVARRSSIRTDSIRPDRSFRVRREESESAFERRTSSSGWEHATGAERKEAHEGSTDKRLSMRCGKGGHPDVEVEAPQSERIMEQSMQKCVLDGATGYVWRQKAAILTLEKLVLANPGEQARVDGTPHQGASSADTRPVITDIVYLHAIKLVEPCHENQGPGSDDLAMAEHVGHHPKLRIVTVYDSDNAGACFVLRMESESAAQEWLSALNRYVPLAKKMHEERRVIRECGGHGGRGFERFALVRHRLQYAYKAYRFQSAVAAMVVLGLITDMTEAQFLPEEGEQLHQVGDAAARADGNEGAAWSLLLACNRS